MTWAAERDIRPHLHGNLEHAALDEITDGDEPLPAWWKWTPTQVIAHCRNQAKETIRATSHHTGATP